jgi:hypothetical protein
VHAPESLIVVDPDAVAAAEEAADE